MHIEQKKEFSKASNQIFPGVFLNTNMRESREFKQQLI